MVACLASFGFVWLLRVWLVLGFLFGCCVLGWFWVFVWLLARFVASFLLFYSLSIESAPRLPLNLLYFSRCRSQDSMPGLKDQPEVVRVPAIEHFSQPQTGITFYSRAVPFP